MEHLSGVNQSVTWQKDIRTSSLLSELKIALALIVNLFPITFFPPECVSSRDQYQPTPPACAAWQEGIAGSRRVNGRVLARADGRSLKAVNGVSPDTPAGPLSPNHRPINTRLLSVPTNQIDICCRHMEAEGGGEV